MSLALLEPPLSMAQVVLFAQRVGLSSTTLAHFVLEDSSLPQLIPLHVNNVSVIHTLLLAPPIVTNALQEAHPILKGQTVLIALPVPISRTIIARSALLEHFLRQKPPTLVLLARLDNSLSKIRPLV